MSYTEQELSLIRIAATAGAQAALRTVEEKEELERKNRYDRKLHNTRLLLKNYRLFNEHINNATYKKEQITSAEALDWANELFDPKNKADQIVIAIKNSAVKTRIMVEHINKMVEIYDIHCHMQDKSPKMARRYEAFHGRYIAEERVTYEQVAEKWHVDVRTIQKDIKQAIIDFSGLLFGIEWQQQ